MTGTGRDVITRLQHALLPAGLPVLPRAQIAARYLPAAHGQAPGGDWFDAAVLPRGLVALSVGDVAGGGLAASAAMGQLRAVLNDLLVSDPDLAAALRHADAFAARTPRCSPLPSPWPCSIPPAGSCGTRCAGTPRR